MSAPQPDDGYFDHRPACSKCGRFVKQADVEPINYRPAAGFYGEVDDGHDSHPDCGMGVLVEHRVLWVPNRREEATPPPAGWRNRGENA